MASNVMVQIDYVNRLNETSWINEKISNENDF